jgi:purine-binding chemotaxis protein CheW
MTTRAAGGDSYVLFELAGATYALRSDDIVQLEMVGEPTPVPNAPAWVAGVVSVRGQVIPAVSLRTRFGFARAPYDLRTRLLVVRTGGRTVGLIVDSAREFATIPAAEVRPLPEGVAGLSGRYLRGTAQRGERLLLVIDVPELLTTEASPPDGTPAPAPDPHATADHRTREDTPHGILDARP